MSAPPLSLESGYAGAALEARPGPCSGGTEGHEAAGDPTGLSRSSLPRWSICGEEDLRHASLQDFRGSDPTYLSLCGCGSPGTVNGGWGTFQFGCDADD